MSRYIPMCPKQNEHLCDLTVSAMLTYVFVARPGGRLPLATTYAKSDIGPGSSQFNTGLSSNADTSDPSDTNLYSKPV